MKFRVFKKRMFAAIIDYIIIFATAYTVCALLVTGVFKDTFDQQAAPFMALILLLNPLSQIPRVCSAPHDMLTIMGNVLVAVIFIVEVLYYSLSELLPAKRTPGYKISGIRLLYNSEKSMPMRIIGRNILKVLSRYLFCIPFVISVFDPNGDAIYDMASKIHIGIDNMGHDQGGNI